MLGPPLEDTTVFFCDIVHYGFYSMAWTVLAGWRCFLDFAGVLMIWNRSDMRLKSGEIQRRSCSRSVKSSAHGRHWLTQAQLTRSEIFETS